MGYLSLLVGAGAWIAHLFSIKQFRQKIGRIFVIIALVVGGIFTAVIPGQVLFRILPLRAEIDPTGDLFGWDQAASVLSGIIRSAPDRHYFCFTHKFYLASQIAFYLPEDIELYCLSARIDQYDFWQRDKKLQEKLNKRTGIFFTDEHFKDNPRDLYVFHGKEDRLFLTVHYMGHTREFTFYWCENFDTARTNPRYLNSIPAMSRNLGHTLLNVDNTAFLKINGLAGASKIADRTLWFFGYLGSSEITILLVTLILWIFKRRDFLPFLGTFFLAVAVGSIIVYLLKEAIPATRPSLYFKDVTITVLGPRLKAGSFPSGHSQMVFTAVLFLSWLFPSWLSLFWFLGCCAGFSRVYSGAHFPRDVLAGLIIAVLAFVLARQVMMRVVKFDNSVKKK
jgi:membrane-associated phospholipid phosphatase